MKVANFASTSKVHNWYIFYNLSSLFFLVEKCYNRNTKELGHFPFLILGFHCHFQDRKTLRSLHYAGQKPSVWNQKLSFHTVQRQSWYLWLPSWGSTHPAQSLQMPARSSLTWLSTRFTVWVVGGLLVWPIFVKKEILNVWVKLKSFVAVL